MTNMQYLILNTCGTSVLTNIFRKKKISFNVNDYSNCKTEKDIPSEKYSVIKDVIETLIDEFEGYTIEEAKDASAELNCLLSWMYSNNVKESECYCYLVHSDTFFGEMAAMLVCEWMKKYGFMYVGMQKIDNLNTENFDSFEDGLSYLAKWSFETVVPAPNQKIIFNIAGGFKAFAGFAQILGQFLADETIYQFETGNSIMSIPKMPIMMGEQEFRDNFDDYHRVALCIRLDSYSKLNSLWVKNGKFTPWGQVAWENAKRSLYEEKVFGFVYEKVKEGKEFRESVKGLSPERIRQINERIDELCLFFMSNKTEQLRRLDYKVVKGNHPYSHECDAWAAHGAQRLFCNEKDGVVVVEKLDKGLH